MLKTLEGIGKRLEIYPDRVVVKRGDLLATFVPKSFSDEEVIPFTDMASVQLHEPEKLRLHDCKEGCIQLVITRVDHSRVGLTLDANQLVEAQAIRNHLQAQIGLVER